MPIFAAMATSLTSKRISDGGNQCTNKCFEDFVQSRGRAGRTGSLALPNNSLLDLYDVQQEQCNSLALIPPNTTIRRHSSHCCPTIETDKTSIKSSTNSNFKAQTNPPANNIPQNIPPPVPKRTFKGKIVSKHNNVGSYLNTAESSNLNLEYFRENHHHHHHHHHHHYHRNQNQHQQQHHSTYNFTIMPKSYSGCKDISGSSDICTPMMTTPQYLDVGSEQVSDDDRISLENSVFDEQRTSDLCAMNNSRQSVRSSSDSNKSQNTTDTGYISTNENEKNCYYQQQSQQQRSRISSVDTQSSVDSCLTEKTIDSPLSKDSFKIETGRSIIINDCFSHAQPGKINRNLPAVPVRKQQQQQQIITTNNQQTAIPPRIPPPIKMSTQKLRSIPPTPPVRSQRSLETINTYSMNNNNNNINNNNNNNNNNSSNQQTAIMNAANTTTTTTAIINATDAMNSSQKPDDTFQEGYSKSSLTSIRNKFPKYNKPPPISYPRLHKRQDSNISSDSLSITSSPGYNSKSIESTLLQLTSSPGYNSKSMEAPLLQHASKINRSGIRHQDSSDSFVMTRFNLPQTKMNYRQDSSISSDSFSQISSPGYNSKIMEAPLLLQTIKINNVKQSFKQQHENNKEPEGHVPTSPITKSASTPASLQTIVRFQNGSNMSLQHRIINRRKSSNPYVTNGCVNFRLLQLLLNALALLAIAGGLAAYFNAYPNVKFINKTIITPPRIDEPIEINKNPAPGVCLPVIVKFCQNHNLPYNYTVFPNYIGHFGQPEAQLELEAYDALVDVRCYELVSLFLCSLFVPKCGPTGNTVPPCKSLCTETMRRCGFFFDVFGLGLPEYLTCNLLTDFNNPDECVGLKEVHEARIRARNPVCSGFLCDQKRCIPSDWRCDGHVDCMDQSDESECEFCGHGSIYCGEKRCMSQKHICDGIIDCPYGQDERNCVRLSERNGDLGKGTLEVYKADVKLWAPACVTHWDSSTSPTAVCSLLGYSSVNSSKLTMRGSNLTMMPPINETPALWKMYKKKQSNLIKEFSSCSLNGDYPVVELTCTNFECGKIRNKKYGESRRSKRIVGGSVSKPGDWPFLAAILGGPEQIFYCAGVLIADQWVLTASHCIGNHTLRNINDWTIQLGVTRRHSHTYYGQKVKVRNVIPHPQYNSYIAHDNDIALFQLATRVAFHEHLLPVCLPPLGMKELKPGTLCTVIGWGKREDKTLNPDAASASYEPSVNEVEVPVLDRDVCNEWLDTPNVTLGMICAGYQEGGKDACQGDSGGPLLCPYPDERDRWFVGGIVSWGIMCAHPKLPGVYANVPKYIPWITQQINRYSKSNFDNNLGY